MYMLSHAKRKEGNIDIKFIFKVYANIAQMLKKLTITTRI